MSIEGEPLKKKAKKVSKRVNVRVGGLDMWTLDWAE